MTDSLGNSQSHHAYEVQIASLPFVTHLMNVFRLQSYVNDMQELKVFRDKYMPRLTRTQLPEPESEPY